MKKLLRFNIMLLGCWLLGLSSFSMAASPVANKVPEVFNVVGKVNSVDLVSRKATVGNLNYALASDAVAYDTQGNKISLRRLIKGTLVGLDLYRSEDNKWYIKAFWMIDKHTGIKPNEA